jgi:hypothetical protein
MVLHTQVSDVHVHGFQFGVSLTAVGCRGFAGVRIARVEADGNLIAGISATGAFVGNVNTWYQYTCVILSMNSS